MKLKPVGSLRELASLANKDEGYRKLLIAAAKNLGADPRTTDEAYRWLETNAMETDEEGVVEEVNFCLDLVN